MKKLYILKYFKLKSCREKWDCVVNKRNWGSKILKINRGFASVADKERVGPVAKKKGGGDERREKGEQNVELTGRSINMSAVIKFRCVRHWHLSCGFG